MGPQTGEAAAATVYFDGSCPLCRMEIGHYQRLDSAGSLCFVDVSAPSAAMGAGLDRDTAMARFHIRDAQGQLLSGAAAFVEIWRLVPGWRFASRLASVPGMLFLLEKSYRGFLRLRPFISEFLRRRGW
jgi:predicted DCC family thiol-disulfide oxidoreductase YuxK